MNQARKRDGEWVEVEQRTDGIYANGIKIADVFGDNLHPDFKRLELLT